MRAVAFAVALVGLSSQGFAQEDLKIDMSRIHVSDPAACTALEQKGVDAWMDLDFLMLKFDRGIEAMEFNCRFYDVKSLPGHSALFVSAICQHPGEMYPEILAISPYDDTRIQVIASSQLRDEMVGFVDPPEEGPPGSVLYTRCDSLSELPR